MWGDQALERFIIGVYSTQGRPAVLDIGSGQGEQAMRMSRAGLAVDCCDLRAGCEYMQRHEVPSEYDGIWACHVLEHILNVHAFLTKVYRELKVDGLLGVTVPPAKPEVVGGHVSLWTPGLLLYRLILAGFDCREARVGFYGYNISVLVRKRPITEQFELCMDAGDVATLAKYFPVPFKEGQHGYEGLTSVNWE